MNLQDFRTYCLNLKNATEDFPFDETTLCFRIGGKIFAITDIIDQPFRFNLKNTPEKIVELREKYNNIIPGYHCNKKYWNTIIPDSIIPNELIIELINDSYNLVFESLPKKMKIQISDLK